MAENVFPSETDSILIQPSKNYKSICPDNTVGNIKDKKSRFHFPDKFLHPLYRNPAIVRISNKMASSLARVSFSKFPFG